MRRRFIVGVFGLLVAGCASSTINYTPPSVQEAPTNEIQINQDFDTVWDRLVRNLSADFFVINNIEKASRLINVSVSSQNPSDFVNCGTTSRTFSNPQGEQRYRYETASSSRFSATTPEGGAFNAIRSPTMDARANIYVAPDGDGTEVRVNVRYVIDVDVQYFTLAGQPITSDNVNWSFNTLDVFRDVNPEATIVCVSLGTLEDRILSAAEP